MDQFIQDLDLKQDRFDRPPVFNYDHFNQSLLCFVKEFLKEKKIIHNDGRFKGVMNRPSLESNNSVEKVIYKIIKEYDGRRTINSLTSDNRNCIFEAILNAELKYAGESLVLKRKDGRCRLKKWVTRKDLEDSNICFLFNQTAKEKYLPMNCQRIKDVLIERIQSCFDVSFVKQLREIKKSLKIHLHRGLLPQQYTFAAQSVTDFLANARLSARIQRRRIRQAQEDEERQEINGETFQTAWQLPRQKYLVLEIQKITSKGSRSDQVINLKTYGRVNNNLNHYKKTINSELDKQHKLKLSDRIIAVWLRDILINGIPKTPFKNKEGKKLCFSNIPEFLRISFLKFLINLCYLLFGCEIQRNPASFVTHQMMLDLIILYKLSWTQALSHIDYEKKYGGGVMPMSMGACKKADNKKATAHPVPCARVLQKYYGIFTVKPWHYDGECASESINNIQKEQTKELIRRQNAITEKWLCAKELDEKPIDQQISIIEEQAREWYSNPKI